MSKLLWIPLYLVGIIVCFSAISDVTGSPLSVFKKILSSQEALEFVTKAEMEIHKSAKKYVQVSWDYKTNITDENEKKYLEYKVSRKHI